MRIPESQWAPKREFNNAKFEGYKLSFDDDDEEEDDRSGGRGTSKRPVIRMPAGAGLPGRTLRGGGDARLGFREARNRAKWNHLSPGRAGEAAWIDNEGCFWMIDLVEPGEAPRKVVALPETVLSEASSSTSTLSEYPTARYLCDNLWAVSDGLGRLYIVNAQEGSIVATHELTSPTTNELQPFSLHSVTAAGSHALAILSHAASSNEEDNASDAKQTRRSQNAAYSVILVKIDLAATTMTIPAETPQVLTSLLALRGGDLPSYTAFVDERCCIGSTVFYKAQGVSDTAMEPIDLDDPASHEIVGTPVAPATSTESKAESSTRPPAPPPPYSWNQMSDSLTVVFPLPSTTNVEDIKVAFTQTTVSLSVQHSRNDEMQAPLPQLLRAKLWDHIDAGISTWTWEKTGGDKGKFGILALHLEKKHEDTRWPHVFKMDDNPEVEKAYLEVEETIDRSELLKITEALEKYTSDVVSDGKSGLAGIEQRSSLLGDEIDMEVDAPEGSSGKGVLFTWVDLASMAVIPRVTEEMTDLVSVPLPSSKKDSSIIVKYDVDGLLFSPRDARWEQVSTYPALAFVLASKRDVVQVYHVHEKLCLALEAGSPVSSNASAGHSSSYAASKTARMNAYLYYPPPPGSKDKNAKQKVVGLADPAAGAGAVLGAVSVEREDGKVDVAVLCEKQVVVLRELL